MNEQKMQYLKNNYRVFGVVSIVYGIIYSVLLYKNPESFIFPIVIALTLAICAFVLKKFGLPIKKEGYFLMVVIQLLAVAVCLTENQKIITFNKVAIFLLLFFFMMEQVYNTKGWQVGKNIGNLIMRGINILIYYGKPWSHLGAFFMGKEERNNKKRKYIAIGIGISIPLVLTICGLLASADEVFRSFFEWIFENLLSVDAILIIFIAIIAYGLIYSFICSSVTTSEIDEKERTKLPTMVAITFTSIIALIYIGFCALQVSYLFNGYSDGLTYSQFAREGFFELLAVSAINLIMVIICIEVFEKSKKLDVILIIISAYTYILIGSSAYRMLLYVDAYELTFLRIFVLWFLAVLTIWMTGAIIYIKKRNWNYFKFSILVIATMYLIFVYVNPDQIIIEYNVKHNKEITLEDVEYFCSELNLKEVLAEMKNMEKKFVPSEKKEIERTIQDYCICMTSQNNDMDWWEFNFAKRDAYNEMKTLGILQ
jgi:Nitric oxide reductase large subunit